MQQTYIPNDLLQLLQSTLIRAKDCAFAAQAAGDQSKLISNAEKCLEALDVQYKAQVELKHYKKQELWKEAQHFIDIMQNHLPWMFPKESSMIRPIAIGSFDDIVSYYGFTSMTESHVHMRRVVAQALRNWCTRPSYLKSIMRFEYRTNIRGEYSPVLGHEKILAERNLRQYNARKKKREESKAAEYAAWEQSVKEHEEPASNELMNLENKLILSELTAAVIDQVLDEADNDVTEALIEIDKTAA